MYKKDYLEQKHRYDEAKKRVKRVINDYLIENKTYKTMKQKIRLTESQLHNVIRRCINEALEEMSPKQV